MANGPSPWIYIFPAVVLAAVLLYYLYGAVDRMGLETHQAEAVITEKSFAEGSTTYRTNVAAGRAWTQSLQGGDAHIVGLNIDGVATIGIVSKEMYDSLSTGDRVRVKFQRTRFSNRLLVTDVRR